MQELPLNWVCSCLPNGLSRNNQEFSPIPLSAFQELNHQVQTWRHKRKGKLLCTFVGRHLYMKWSLVMQPIHQSISFSNSSLNVYQIKIRHITMTAPHSKWSQCGSYNPRWPQIFQCMQGSEKAFWHISIWEVRGEPLTSTQLWHGRIN